MCASNNDSEDIKSIDEVLAGLLAGYAGLRRFLLEWHSEATGTPMNRSEERLRDYIDAEIDRLIAAADTANPELGRRLRERRGQLPPT